MIQRFCVEKLGAVLAGQFDAQKSKVDQSIGQARRTLGCRPETKPSLNTAEWKASAKKFVRFKM